MSVKQVIVIRKDLNMRKGKCIVQGAHASMKIFFDRWHKVDNQNTFITDFLPDTMVQWIEGLFTKICVSVNSEAELLEIYEKAKEANIPVALIEDAGLTEFKGILTKTCIALGPDESEKIDKLTGHLSLL